MKKEKWTIFPQPPFTKLSDVEEWAEESYILCLNCGKELKTLNNHIGKCGFTEKEYRNRFNIPPTIALACKETRRKMSASQKIEYANNKEHREKFIKGRGKSKHTYIAPNPLFDEKCLLAKKVCGAKGKARREIIIPEDVLLKMKASWKDGINYRQLEEEFGFNRTTIWRNFKKDGWLEENPHSAKPKVKKIKPKKERVVKPRIYNWKENKRKKVMGNRRKVLPGFPIQEPFKNIDQAREYVSHDKITCLLCGKSFTKLGGPHLKLHGVTSDEYREMYNIPWTYGLASVTCRERHKEITLGLMEAGVITIGHYGEDQIRFLAKSKKRKEVFKREIAAKNLGDHYGPIKHNTDGKATERKMSKVSKWGSEEHKVKQFEHGKKNYINGKFDPKYWEGRQQPDEHLAKRILRQLGFSREEVNTEELLDYGVVYTKLTRQIKSQIKRRK